MHNFLKNMCCWKSHRISGPTTELYGEWFYWYLFHGVVKQNKFENNINKKFILLLNIYR